MTLLPLTPGQKQTLQDRALVRVYGARVPPRATATVESARFETGKREAFQYVVVRQPRKANVVYRIRVIAGREAPELRPLTRVPKALR